MRVMQRRETHLGTGLGAGCRVEERVIDVKGEAMPDLTGITSQGIVPDDTPVSDWKERTAPDAYVGGIG